MTNIFQKKKHLERSTDSWTKTTGMPTIKTNHSRTRWAIVTAIGLSILLYLPLIMSDVDRLTLGRFLGLVGLQLIWWQIILGNRQLVRLVTPDLLWVNRLHRLMGTYGFLLILFHPLLMISIYGLSLVWPPSFASGFDIGVRLGATALMLLAFVWFTSALFRTKIAWRLWKRSHYLGYVIFPLICTHMLLVGSSRQQYWWLGLWLSASIAAFWGVVLLRVLAWGAVTKQRYRVVETTEVARDVTRFWLQPTGKGIKPRPGQFAYFQGWRYGEAHPFTVSHYDEESGEISFSIKAVGPYSNRLTRLMAGDIIYIDGPYGTFTEEIAHSDRPVVAIAGGIGITPFIRNLEMGHIDYLFLACRTKDDIAYRNTIESSNVKTSIILSEPAKKEPGYEYGTIDAALLTGKLKNSLSEYDFYLCGPPPMMKSLVDQLVEHGVSPRHIYQEKFSL